MNQTFKILIPLVLLSLAALALASCGPAATGTPCPPTQECPECPPSPTCPPPPTPAEEEPAVQGPFMAPWLASAHADETSESFVHWDEDDPPQVPPACAKCHSAPGYKDYLGIDGTAAGQVDNPADIGTVVNCTVCHNEGTQAMTSVSFPSGLEATGLGSEATCYHCHQIGRAHV